VVAVRRELGAALLLPWALHRGALRGLRGRGGAIAAYAACEIAVPFVLIAMGERYISSSLAAILIATMPLFVDPGVRDLGHRRARRASWSHVRRRVGADSGGSWLSTGGRVPFTSENGK